VRLRGHGVTSRFALPPNGRFEALLTGLRVGKNELTAGAPGRVSDSVTIVNHAGGGPVLSGPQVKPWVCQNGSKSPKCDKKTTYQYEYMSTIGGGFQPYDPKNPPSDAAMTTTQNATKVPFVIRIE